MRLIAPLIWTWLADAGNPLRPLDPRFAQVIQGSINHVYGDFIAIAAKARKTTPEKINEVAQGRVWTGTQAKANGLIDEFGGLEKAIDIAKELATLATMSGGRLLPAFGLGAVDPVEQAAAYADYVAKAQAVSPAFTSATQVSSALTAAQGTGAEVIDPRTTSPLDEDIILSSVEKTGRLIHECVTNALWGGLIHKKLTRIHRSI